MNPELRAAARLLFTEARSHGHWLPRPIAPALLIELYELMKFGPTSMNSQPMRVLFICSTSERERLAGCVNPGNIEKVRSAPVVAVIGQDPGFVELLATHFPHKKDALAYYQGKPEVVDSTALRNSSLQGGYLIMAARLLGLDCGPMSGFNA